MLDARTSGVGHVEQQTQPSTSDQEPPARRPQKKVITKDEIVGQAFVFLLAGFETSRNTLAFTCYLLALHPESQSKVQEEVDTFFATHVSVSLLSSSPRFYSLRL